MADKVDREKTVVVEEDSEQRSNVGWAILLIAIALVILFFLFGGFGLFGTDTSDGNTDVTPATDTQIQTETTSPTPVNP